MTSTRSRPPDERARVPAQAREWDLDGCGRIRRSRRSELTWRGFDARWAASARSLSTRRCASTRLASEARPRRTRMPVHRSNGSNVAAWMTRVPPATGSSRQLHSLSKPDAGHPDPEPRFGSRLEALDPGRVTQQPEPRAGGRVVAAAGQAGAAGPSRSSGKRTVVGRRVVERRPHRARRRHHEDAAFDGAGVPDASSSGRPSPRAAAGPHRHLSRRSGARPSSSRGRRRSIRDVRRRRRRASRSGPRRPASGGATGA